MKQIIILSHDLEFKELIESYDVPKVFDCIVPQKTTLTFDKNIKVEENDIIVVRDAITLNEEYLGIVETKDVSNVLTLLIVPFIALMDNDLLIKTLDGSISVQQYILDEININFVETDDVLNKYNIVVNDMTEEEVKYKVVDTTSNLMEILNEIYLNTGIYVDFSLKYDLGKIVGINCNIYNANEQDVKKIRFDNPQIIDKIDYKFSQYGNYNKASIKVGESGKTYYFYLREDNRLTTNPKDQLRLKRVRNKNLTLTADYGNEDQLAEALVLLAQSELCGDAFAYSIEFTILRNAINDWRYRQRCDFRAEDKLYESYITQIEYLNEKEAKVMLGAFRYTLTDKFKNLLKPKQVIGGTFNGINISTALGKTVFWFTQEDGDLILNYEGDIAPNFNINEENELIYTYDEEVQQEPNFNINQENELEYIY